MPVVQVHLWEGRTEDQIKEIIEGITDGFVKMGSKLESVRFLVQDYYKTHWNEWKTSFRNRLIPFFFIE